MSEDNKNHGAPDWLTREYLEQALQKYQKDDTLRITDLKIRPALPKGENYASVMTRVGITFEYGKDNKNRTKQQSSYIVKSSFQGDPIMEDIFRPYQTFQTEMDIYEKVLPKLSALLCKIGDTDKLFAETIFVDYLNEAIIFEDLSVLGYEMADRISGFDETSAKLSLKKLAKLHATAVVLNQHTNGSLEQFKRGIFNRYSRNFGVFFEDMLSVCADFAGECPDLGIYYKEKLLKLKAHLVEYAIRDNDVREGQFHTLNHGDFWINNVMLHHNDETNNDKNPKKEKYSSSFKMPTDIVLIDFQFSKWTSPAWDLHYFLNTSLKSELRLNGQEKLVFYYHNVLTKTLVDLNYDGYMPSLHELWVQLEDRRFLAAVSTLCNQPFMINDKCEEDADAKGLLLDDERGRNFRKMLYQNKSVQENVKSLLPFFDQRGLLDVVN